MVRVLVVEDDELQRKAVVSYLVRRGFDAVGVEGPNEAWDELYEKKADIVITDIMMSPVDGFEFAEALRQDDPDIPVMFISARGDMNAKARGFSLGIDDYMVKPIELEELELRIGSLLRRYKIEKSRHLEAGDLVLDLDEYSAAVSGEEVHLTKREFELLYKLLSYPRKVFTRAQLMEGLWDGGSEASPRSVDVLVTRLRDKIAASGSVEIQTVHGLGYKAVVK